MKLKSFGCSFIFGNELADDGHNGSYVVASQLTWPAHLAQHINHSYSCYARPGAGNLQIAEQVLNQIGTSQADDVFVIGWTWVDRFDYYSVNPTDLSCSQWTTLMPADQTTLAKTYYKELHSEYRDKLTTLINIKLVIDSLRQKQITFLMTYMDCLIFDRRWNTSAAVSDLQNFVEPYMTQFEGMSFLEWSKKNKYPISTVWHPLDEAHRAAGDYMIKIFDTQKNKPLHLKETQ
jgi:hypothetical protein